MSDTELPAPCWVKSSLSTYNGNCAEVADLGGGTVGVRNSRDREGPVLRFASGEWQAFTGGVRNGEFDRLGRGGRAAVTAPARALSREEIEQVARVCHAANAELQKIHDDGSPSLPWDSETGEIRQGAIAGVERALAGVTPEELHAGWCRDRAAEGWRRGAFKDREAKVHPALVPYAELPAHQRVKDLVFIGVVQAMSEGMRLAALCREGDGEAGAGTGRAPAAGEAELAAGRDDRERSTW